MFKKLEWYKHKCDKMLNHEDTLLGQCYALFMAALVLIICGNFVAETYIKSPNIFQALITIDRLITFMFLIDYLLRFWVKNFSIRYLFTPMALIDLVTIIPIFLPRTQLQFVRVLRVFRILRLLRVFRKNGIIFIKYTEFHLRVLRILFTIFCLVFISSGLIYEIESSRSPETFATFFDAVYFSIVTLTTVGYGDIIPVSTQGRLITVIIIMTGVLLIPWQFMTLARYLVGDINKLECPCSKCGLSVHDVDASHCKNCGKILAIRDLEG
ncbi:MAG: ion transporter [Chlamydiota bacterium]|nr:ion transporter [Chlamydiota bacterium]